MLREGKELEKDRIMKRKLRKSRRKSKEGNDVTDEKAGSTEKCGRKRNVHVVMIKSSLLADLPEVPSGREKENESERRKGKLAVRVRLASFYAALCLRPLSSYLTNASPFIFSSIDSSPRAQLDELGRCEPTIPRCAAEL